MAGAAGVAIIMVTQNLVLTGSPTLWYYMEMLTVNTFGLPVFSGLIPTLAILGGGIWWTLRYAQRNGNGLIQRIILAIEFVKRVYFTKATFSRFRRMSSRNYAHGLK